jgi:integrase
MSAPLVKTATPGIYKRGSRYVVTFRDPYGKPRKKAARTLAEARALKGQLTADVQRGEYRPVKKVPFTEYALDWIDHYGGRSSRGVRPETVADYRRRLEREAIPFFGRMPLAAIQPADIKRFARHVASRGVSASTVRLALAPVKAMLADAFEAGDIRANPSAGVRLALNGTGAQEDEHVKALTEEELGRLLAQIPEEWRLFFELLAQTGLRIGEAIALRFGDVDFDRRRTQVRRRYYRGGFASPKSRYGIRDVPIGPGLAGELELRWLLVDDVEALVFPSSTGTVLDADNLRRRVLKPAARRAGVPWAGFHTFRHTCATTLFHRGVNPKQAQVWLGHHSPAFTLAVYTHLLSGDLPDVDLLEGGNNGATSPTETRRNGDRAERAETRIGPSPGSAALAIQSVS